MGTSLHAISILASILAKKFTLLDVNCYKELDYFVIPTEFQICKVTTTSSAVL